jgi:glycosyltransferase involved in cell wall biosynthesis
MKRLVAPVYNGFGDFVLRNHAQAIVTVAHHCANELTSKGIDGRKITVVHNGIPDKMALEDDRTRIRREWGIDDQTIIVMAASQLVPYKGIDYLIDGFVRQLVNRPLKACLMILGRGPYENDLKQRVVRLGRENEIRFGGMRSDIVECFAAADVFVLPSLVEAHSIALLEAMRAGIPIIATDVGGNTESVRHEREALIVPPADSTALSESLERLLVNETLRNQLGKAARTRFLQEFTDSCMIEATAKWFANVIC